MMDIRLCLVEFGEHLWTRERARAPRERVESMLEEAQPGDTVVIDAKGVEVFDYSFANELFGKTLLRLPKEHPGRFLLVEHLTKYTHENLAKALESLNLMMIAREGRRLKLIGKLHPTDAETFDAIDAAKEPVTATVLKDRLGINLTAVNERLHKLTGMGIVRREKGRSSVGREVYSYSVPT